MSGHGGGHGEGHCWCHGGGHGGGHCWCHDGGHGKGHDGGEEVFLPVGDVTSCHSYRQVDREEEKLLGPGHEEGVEQHGASFEHPGREGGAGGGAADR